MSGQVAIEDVAKGYWYHGIDKAYAGEIFGAFNEHQHLEFFLGFLVRLAHAHKRKQINAEEVSFAFRASYLWHGVLVTKLATTVEHQVSRQPGAEVPVWVEAVLTVNGILGYSGSSFETDPNSVKLSPIAEQEVTSQ